MRILDRRCRRAARQSSGTVGGIALYQVAVTRHAVVLPVLGTRPGPAVPADRHRGRPLAH
jgi:hypothetical protein